MVTLKEVLSDAQRRRIAIGHFNVSDLVGLKAVTGAAEILNVPVLVGTSEGERNFLAVHKIRGRSYLFCTLFWTSGLESVLDHIPR